MVDFLYSADLKLQRANEHLNAVKDEMIAYGERKPYSLSFERNADATRHSAYLRVQEEPPFDSWGLIIGDCLQNLRAALDHAIFGLATARSWPKPPPNFESLAFPICKRPEHFTGSLAKLGVLSQETPVAATVEGLQPYNRRHPPDVPALLLLQDLNNGDKHRVISVTRAAVNGDVTTANLPPGCHLIAKWLIGGTLKDGTEVFRATLDRPAPNMTMELDLKMFPSIYHVADDNGVRRSPVDQVLAYIRDEVAYSINALRLHL